uniref:Serine palmitoyltransferase small subunit B n=1 Tax=Crocodylus porosus TaxID=8502 RepID=A0A7M4ELS6_CROPO
MPKMDIKRVKDYMYWLYYQYLLITCSYVLEPWEQSMFHTVVVTVFAMVVYTAYVFIPIHILYVFIPIHILIYMLIVQGDLTTIPRER